MADQEPVHNGDRHEKRDINVGKVAFLGVVLLGFIAIIGYFVPWFVFDFMAIRTEDQGPPPSPLLSADQTPPPPRLQVHAPADMARMRAAEEQRLSTYSWADRPNGVVRIPIQRAMSLLAERGLGTPQQNQTSGTAPSQKATGVNSGTSSGIKPARK
jgi:hypothetical protein